MRISGRKKISLIALSSLLLVTAVIASNPYTFGSSSTPITVRNPLSLTRTAVGTDLSYAHSSSGTICTQTNSTFWTCPAQTVDPSSNVTLQLDFQAIQAKAITPTLLVLTPGVDSSHVSETIVAQQLTAVCSSSSCSGSGTGPTFSSIQPMSSSRPFWVIFWTLSFDQSSPPVTFTLTVKLQR